MGRIRHGLLAAALASSLALCGARATIADEAPGPTDEAEDMAREAMEQLLQALELFMLSIPQYEMPEINEHGDIIIRRKRAPLREDNGNKDETPAEPDVESTRT